MSQTDIFRSHQAIVREMCNLRDEFGADIAWFVLENAVKSLQDDWNYHQGIRVPTRNIRILTDEQN